MGGAAPARRLLCGLAFLGLAAGCVAAPSPSPAPAPTYPGQVLVLGHFDLVGLTSAATDPVEVGTTPSLSADVRTVSVSDNGRYIVTADGTLERPGSTDVIHLPIPDGMLVHSADFSSDGTQLVYATHDATPGSGSEQLVLYDLATNTERALMGTPCASYGSVGTVCGEMGSALWIDPTTLFALRSAALPDSITCTVPVSATTCGAVAANTYSIVAVGG